MSPHWLKPEYLESVKGLELLARKTVDAFFQGQHRSRRTGAGLEFSNYRTYQPGDDLRMLDWKLYARSDRFFIREAEQQKQLHLRFVLDSSASMLHEDHRLTKLAYARFIVATLAWLGLQQGDELSLHSFSEQQITHLGPKPGKRFFQRLLYQLTQIDGAGKFPEVAHAGLSVGKKKALLIFITDLYEHSTEIQEAIRNMQIHDQEILVLHLMGENELQLDFGRYTTLEDLETGRRIQLGSKSLQQEYQAQLESRLEALRQTFVERGIHYSLVNMKENPGQFLKLFLKLRSKLF